METLKQWKSMSEQYVDKLPTWIICLLEISGIAHDKASLEFERQASLETPI